MFDLTTTTNNAAQTMTSREIAELTGKRHSDVIRDIRNLELQLEDDANLRHEEFQALSDSRGYTSEYLLSKKQTLLLVSGYSVLLRARIIDRWEELENKERQPAINLHDPKQLLDLLQNYAEENLKLQEKVEEAAPKVEFVDSYVEATGLLGFREVCKLLGIKEYIVRGWLVSKGIIYKLGGKWAFSGSWLNAKNGKHKASLDAYGRARTSLKFTPKGFAYIAERISK